MRGHCAIGGNHGERQHLVGHGSDVCSDTGGAAFRDDTAVISGPQALVHGFPYWVYGAMSFLAAAFVYFYVPETKRRTLEDIQNLWTRGSPATAGVN